MKTTVPFSTLMAVLLLIACYKGGDLEQPRTTTSVNIIGSWMDNCDTTLIDTFPIPSLFCATIHVQQDSSFSTENEPFYGMSETGTWEMINDTLYNFYPKPHDSIAVISLLPSLYQWDVATLSSDDEIEVQMSVYRKNVTGQDSLAANYTRILMRL